MDQVAEIKSKIDIAAFIQQYIPLKKFGNNFKANCPFHGEKTPSFVVSPQRQIWHCFGCGKGGDCLSFLMEYEHIEFPEALRILADKVGVQLIQKGFDPTTSTKKEIIYRLNAIAAEFYHFLLTKHAVGAQALAYLQERKIKPQTMTTYMLGFAPKKDTALVEYLQKKKQYKAEDILEAGLASKRYNGIADFFQGRLIFPLYDHRNNIIGFSGRILTNATDTSKYINTRETLVYHKGSVFFGLNSSKEAIKKEERAIVMEGEFDVIAAFQEGITNTVAIKGTAFTPEQASLISRFAKTVTLCLDSDKAGQEAMKRSLPILEEKGITTTIVEIPQGKDPDDAVKSDPAGFKKAVKHARPAYEVILDLLLAQFDITTVDGKKQVGDEILFLIRHINNEIVKEHYIKLLAKTLDISADVLLREMDRIARKEVIKQEVTLPKEHKSREETLEEYLVALLVQSANPPQEVIKVQTLLEDYQWRVGSYPKTLLHIGKFHQTKKSYESKHMLASLPQELLPAFDTCFLLPLPEFINAEEYEKELVRVARDLSLLGLKKQIQDITEQIRIKEKEAKDEEVLQLQENLSILLERRKTKEHA